MLGKCWEKEDYLQSRANDAPSALSDDDIRSIHSEASRVRSEKTRRQQENGVSSFERTQAYVDSLSAHPLPSATWRGERGAPAHNLARIQVPKFKGNPDKWPYFWGIFSALVDKNERLPSAIKFARLINALSEEVKEVVSCLTGESGDYERAVSLLTDRYGDPRDVIDAHLRRITGWPSVREKDRSGFERYADALQAAVFALDKPAYRHGLRSHPLCTQLVRKLPPSDKDEWVRQVERDYVDEDVRGFAEWAQARAKTLRKRERYNDSPISTTPPSNRNYQQKQ